MDIPGVKIDAVKHALPKECYFQEEQKKDLVVLHFTAGFSAESSVNFWKTQKNRVSTPYIIDNDGSVYQCYDPKYWSYHLGIPKASHNNDKRSIAVEISNIGPLKRQGETLYCWPGGYTKTYCKLSEAAKYVKKPYRGFDYYAAYTPAQIESAKALMEQLCNQFSIPKRVIPNEDEFNLSFASQFKGIAGHQNFRGDKCDPATHFPWDDLRSYLLE